MKKLVSLLLAFAFVLVLATGCSSQSTATQTSESAAPAESSEAQTGGKSVKIGISWAMKNAALMYGMEDAIKENTEATAKERGYDSVEWVDVIAESDAKKQSSDIQDLITQKCDLIIVYAVDSVAIGSSIDAAKAAGIPIVLWDRDADASVTQPDAFIGLDTVAQAYTTGVALFEGMKAAGVEPTDVVSVIGDLGDQNAINRQKGFKQAADEYGVTIKQEVPSEWNVEKALSGFTTAMLANPNCNTVLVASDFIFPAIQSVLEQNEKWVPAGEEGHVWIGSQDVYPEVIQITREGYIDYNGAYDLDAMAKALAPVALDLINGVQPTESKIFAAGLVVDQTNIDSLPSLWSIKYENS